MFYTALAVPLGIVFGVVLAMLLDAKIRGLSVYRTLFFLPSIVPIIILFFLAQRTFIQGIATTGAKG